MDQAHKSTNLVSDNSAQSDYAVFLSLFGPHNQRLPLRAQSSKLGEQRGKVSEQLRTQFFGGHTSEPVMFRLDITSMPDKAHDAAQIAEGSSWRTFSITATPCLPVGMQVRDEPLGQLVFAPRGLPGPPLWLDEIGSERAALLGVSEGGPMSLCTPPPIPKVPPR